MNRSEKLQSMIERVDNEIERLTVYYFLHEDSYPIQSLGLVMETALSHPDLSELMPGKSLVLLLSDVKQVKRLVTLITRCGKLKRRLYLDTR